MNALEQGIMRGARNARRSYGRMTGGYWLWHGPESFLQIMVAQEISRLGYCVYVDASLKKAKMDFGVTWPGRPPHNSRQRPDISVWHKSDDTLRAIIEIKRAWSIEPLQRDASKIMKCLGQKGAPKSGYILAYSEARGEKRLTKLDNRFDNWAANLSFKLLDVNSGISDDPDWAWGLALLRCA